MLSCPKYKLGKSFNLKKNKINKSKLWSEIICNNQKLNVNYSTVNQAVILFFLVSKFIIDPIITSVWLKVTEPMLTTSASLITHTLTQWWGILGYGSGFITPMAQTILFQAFYLNQEHAKEPVIASMSSIHPWSQTTYIHRCWTLQLQKCLKWSFWWLRALY